MGQWQQKIQEWHSAVTKVLGRGLMMALISSISPIVGHQSGAGQGLMVGEGCTVYSDQCTPECCTVPVSAVWVCVCLLCSPPGLSVVTMLVMESDTDPDQQHPQSSSKRHSSSSSSSSLSSSVLSSSLVILLVLCCLPQFCSSHQCSHHYPRDHQVRI